MKSEISNSKKDLILSTALWGWGIDKISAFKILDNFVDNVFKKIDVATNYPINGEYKEFGQTISWLKEWINCNNPNLINVICKLGSLSNNKSKTCNLSKSFLLTNKALITEKIGRSLFCLMIHWDNRSKIYEVAETTSFMEKIYDEGINVGLSGIKYPKLYYDSSLRLRSKWFIQVKENLIDKTSREKYFKFFPHAKYQAYGINLGGIKLEKNDKSISARLRNIQFTKEIKEKIKSLKEKLNHFPAERSVYEFLFDSIYQQNSISEIIIAPSNLNQLKSILTLKKIIDKS